jgi:hypothetical protein
MSSIEEKKKGITESKRWRNVVVKEKINQKQKNIYILLPPQIFKKECITVYSESKYYIK